MYKKIAYISAAFILVIVLAGCQLFVFGGGKEKPVAITQEGLRTGTDALVMSFYPEAPPNETYESSSTDLSQGVFQVALVLANKGAYDITNGKVVLSYDDTFLKILQDTWLRDGIVMPGGGSGNFFPLNIKGKSIDNPDGETFTYSKNFKTMELGEQRQSKEVNLMATACYDYHTQKGVPICIDTMPFAKIKKACETKPVAMQDQGAPLAITRVEPKLIQQGNEYTLEVYLYLKNKGNGLVYKSGRTETACGDDFPSLSNEKFFNILEEPDVSLKLSTDNSPNQFKCGIFPLRLSDKESYLRCVYNSKISQTAPYMTTLFVDISYGYTQSTSKTTKIIRRIAFK